MKPSPQTIPAFYKGYVDFVKDMDLIKALTWSSDKIIQLIKNIPESEGEYRYAAGKWSIKEVLVHIMDAERIFAYRALRFSRNDKTDLPGFDEKAYAGHANANGRTLDLLSDEMKKLRLTTIDLYNSFTEDMLNRTGTANNNMISVLNLGYIIAGHECHHGQILTERYLKN